MPLSVEKLRESVPKQYCSECDTVKPYTDFPVSQRKFKMKAGRVCQDCLDKKREGRAEPTVVGISESEPMLKGLNEVKEEDNVLAESEYQEDEPRVLECTECREFKELEEFDTSKTICEECVEILKRVKKRKVEPTLEKEVPKTKTITKICSTCNKVKPLTEYYKSKKGVLGLTSQCKDCLDLSKHKSFEKRALNDLWPELAQFRENETFNIKEVVEKCNGTKGVIWELLKILVELDYLTVTKVGNMNLYSFKDKTTDKGVFDFDIKTGHDKDTTTYDPVINSLPEPKPMVNERCKVDCPVDYKPNDNRKPILADDQRIPSGRAYAHENPGDDPITNGEAVDSTFDKVTYDRLKENKEELNKGVVGNSTFKSLYDIEKRKQSMVVELVELSYPEASKIEITPATHEIMIKMRE